MANVVNTIGQPNYGVGGSFRVDTTDLMKLALNFEQGTKVVQREMLKGMRLATSDTRENIRQVAPNGESGKLKANLETRILQTNSLRSDGVNAMNAGRGITGEVRIQASKVKYAWWVNYGRGAIRPVNKKWLRFRWRGAIVFTKYVKPKAGSFFMERGLSASGGDIARAMHSAADRIVRWIATAR